jgi:hypothetical protein
LPYEIFKNIFSRQAGGSYFVVVSVETVVVSVTTVVVSIGVIVVAVSVVTVVSELVVVSELLLQAVITPAIAKIANNFFMCDFF